MLNLIPWPWRLLGLGALVAACMAFGWVKGAAHVQAAWDAATVKESLIVARQQARVERIEAAQFFNTEKISHETDRALAASDEYWRLRFAAGPRRLPETPGAAGATDGTAEAAAPGAAGCAEADGSADAIVILEWQRWWQGIRAANRAE